MTGDDVDPFAGIGPCAGISVLPEGWLKIPLELTASYRLPLTLFDAATDEIIGFSIEAHWIEHHLRSPSPSSQHPLRGPWHE